MWQTNSRHSLGGHVGRNQRFDALQGRTGGLASELDGQTREAEVLASGVGVQDSGQIANPLGHGCEYIHAENAPEVKVDTPEDKAADVGFAASGLAYDLPDVLEDGALAAPPVSVAKGSPVPAGQAALPSFDLRKLRHDAPAVFHGNAVEAYV